MDRPVDQFLSDGTIADVERFWVDVTSRGTPVIKPVDVLPDGRLASATFFWRGTPQTRRVSLISSVYDWDPEKAPLTNVPNTNVWYRTAVLRSDLRTVYTFDVDDGRPRTPRAVGQNGDIDPLNPHTTYLGRKASGAEDGASILKMPKAPRLEWTHLAPDVRRGRLEAYRIDNSILGNQREVQIYTPAGYNECGEACSLLVCFDGVEFTQMVSLPTVLDNLIASACIPPTVAVFISSRDWETRCRELTCSPETVNFLQQEVLPWIHQNFDVSTDPQRRTIAGSSLGGLAAVHAAFSLPRQFGNALSMSGQFYPLQVPGVDWDGAQRTARFREQIADGPHRNIRVHFDAGLLEGTMTDGVPGILRGTHEFCTMLHERGYEVSFRDFPGGHDYMWWQETFADALQVLTPGRNAPSVQRRDADRRLEVG